MAFYPIHVSVGRGRAERAQPSSVTQLGWTRIAANHLTSEFFQAFSHDTVLAGGSNARPALTYGTSPLGGTLIFHAVLLYCFDVERRMKTVACSIGRESIHEPLQLFTRDM